MSRNSPEIQGGVFRCLDLSKLTSPKLKDIHIKPINATKTHI